MGCHRLLSRVALAALLLPCLAICRAARPAPNPSPAPNPAPAPVPPPLDPVKELAGVIKNGTGVFFVGAGISAALLDFPRELDPSAALAHTLFVGSFTRNVLAVANEAITSSGVDPRLPVWVKLAFDCYVPVNITSAQVDGNLTAAGWKSYGLNNLTALQAVAKKIWPNFNSQSCPDGGGCCIYGAENGATLVVDELTRKSAGRPHSLQLKYRTLFEIIATRNGIQANKYAPLTSPSGSAPLTKLAQVTPVFTTNYDSFLEQALGRTGIDYKDIAQDIPKDPALGFLAMGNNVTSQFVVHLHGFSSPNDDEDFVITLADYARTMDTIVKFLVPLAKQKSIVFLGSSSGMFDPHFLELWKQLMLAKSTRKHYVVIRETELTCPWCIITAWQQKLGDVGKWMQKYIVPLVFTYESFNELPVYLEKVAAFAF